MDETGSSTDKLALFNLGFRPFFLGASIYSVVVVLFWLAIYGFNIYFPIRGLTIFQWHAHEMIYGYSLAVIAGFLLTAVKNWTGIQTARGIVLAIIFSLWLAARLLFLSGSIFIEVAAIFDLLFVISLIIATASPVIRARNWRQLGILSNLILLAVANSVFYLGYTGILEQGMYWGIYGGLYLVIGMILILGSRVIPFFIERGVGYPVQLYNPGWLTPLVLLIFIAFFISELFLHDKYLTGSTASVLFIIFLIRLTGWHTPGIWRKPLLWGLYVAMLFIIAGFLMFALNAYAGTSKYLAIHALAYGGIGMITVSMMARVSIGHTGRNVNEPPVIITYILVLLTAGSIARVILPLLDMSHYRVWVIISQVFWIIAFSLFLVAFAPVLIKARIDDQPG